MCKYDLIERERERENAFYDVFIFMEVLYFIVRRGVMQSDRNSFCRDVVSGSFNKTSWNEDNILDQIYKSKYVRIIIMLILILYNILRNTTLALKSNFMSLLLL